MLDDCGDEFKDRNEFSNHSIVSHAQIVKKIMKPNVLYRQMHNFYLIATPLTKASRIIMCRRDNSKQKEYNIIRKLGRRPFKDELNIKSIKEKCKNYF